MTANNKYFNVKSGGVTLSGIAYQRPQLTRQTTIYRTGDDGWHLANGTYDYTPPVNPINIAELAGFTVLKNNNFFGNTNRFTDENGLQVYGNNYIIDHLTGLGWSTSRGFANWDDLIDAANIYVDSLGHNDYRIPNIQEVNSIYNTQTTGFNYAPFNTFWTPVSQYYTSSTTCTNTTGSRLSANWTETGRAIAKTAGSFGLRCRNHYTSSIVTSTIAYQRPISTGRITSWYDGDYGYHRGLGSYNYAPPTNFTKIPQLDWTVAYVWDRTTYTQSPFATLKENNVFGNKSRFTDKVGNEPGSFTSNYIIDHLTGLAWKRVLSSLVTWTDALDAAQAETFEGESGWRVCSIEEFGSIADYAYFKVLNYIPMSSLKHSNNQWTNMAQNSTRAYYYNPVHGQVLFNQLWTNTARYLLCRNHF